MTVGTLPAEMIREREERMLQLSGADTGWAIEQLSDQEFEQLLELDRRKQERVRKIIMNRLVDGEDYGTVPGIQKPFPWEGAADKILNLLRWSCRPIQDPALTFDGDVFTASVTVGVFDLAGRLKHSTTRACSTRERRFQNKTTKGWKFNDPRECTNECIAIAFKRGKIAATMSASAAKGYFANPEQLIDNEEAAQAEAGRWLSDEEQRELVGEAKAAGIATRDAWIALQREVCPEWDGKRVLTVGEAVAVRAAILAHRPSPTAPATERGDAFEGPTA